MVVREKEKADEGGTLVILRVFLFFWFVVLMDFFGFYSNSHLSVIVFILCCASTFLHMYTCAHTHSPPRQVLGEQLKAQTQVAARARAQLRDAGAGSNPSSSAATGFVSGENGGDASNQMDQKQAALRSLQDERDRLEGELSEALEKVRQCARRLS